jgi:hypothetical protein
LDNAILEDVQDSQKKPNNELNLFFVSGSSLELEKTSFVFVKEGQPRYFKATRGHRLARNVGCFKWSSAVKATCLLLIKAKIIHLTGDEAQLYGALLEGKFGTPASSLDYSYSKVPGWMVDIFGLDQSGNPNIRSIVGRDNPEQKRDAPVRIYLNFHILHPRQVNIYIDDSLVESENLLEYIYNEISDQFSRSTKFSKKTVQAKNINFIADTDNQISPPITDEKPVKSEVLQNGIKEILKRISVEESEFVIRKTKIFTRQDLLSSTKAILEHPLFKSISGGSGLDFVAERFLTPSSRIGFGSSSLLINKKLKNKPLELALDATSVPALLILMHLKDYKNVHLSFNYHFADTTELVKKLTQGGLSHQPDGFMLTAATTATYLLKSSNPDYLPLIILPKVTHRVVASGKSVQDINYGDYLMMQDIPGTSRFYFETMIHNGIINQKKISNSSLDADEIFALMKQSETVSDLRSVLFFPHYQLNKIFNSCTFLDDDHAEGSGVDQILFLHRRFFEDDFAVNLNVEIRNSWLSLKTNKLLLRTMIDSLFDNEDYFEVFNRFCGLHSIY